MTKIAPSMAFSALALALTISACSSGDGTNPVTTGPDGTNGTDTPTTPGDTSSNSIPESLGVNLNGFAYDTMGTASTADDTLTVQLTSLDAGAIDAVYARNAALDVPGYTAFSVQADPLDRLFVAVTAESLDGSVQAIAVSDGGQFTTYFFGSSYARAAGASVPTTGQVSYAGTYAGITNLDDLDQDQRLPIPAGTDPSLVPAQPRQTQGDMFLNVNFADGATNGSIYNRQFTDGEALPTVFLTDGAMDANGEFLGNAQFIDGTALVAAGEFGGIIGNNGDSVAGVVRLDTIFLPSDTARDGDFDAEIGAFVLPRCGTAGAPPPPACP